MKKIISISFSLLLLAACGNDNNKEKSGSEAGNNQNPEYKKGLALIAKSDCFQCHDVSEPKTGPTYREVAEKYAAGTDSIKTYLEDKIRHGGSGVWGQAPMIAHPDLTQDEIKSMVNYILSLKK